VHLVASISTFFEIGDSMLPARAKRAAIGTLAEARYFLTRFFFGRWVNHARFTASQRSGVTWGFKKPGSDPV
jgi:hypothetical protein